MPSFDIPCDTDFHPKCDCELRCYEIGGGPDCAEECADGRPDCDTSIEVSGPRSLCHSACAAIDTAQLADCSAAFSACAAAATTEGELHTCVGASHACSYAVQLATLACGDSCESSYTGRLTEYFRGEAFCRANQCERAGGTYSRQIAQCQNAYGRGVAALETSFQIGSGICTTAATNSIQDCTTALDSAVGGCIASFPDPVSPGRASCMASASLAGTNCSHSVDMALLSCHGRNSQAYWRSRGPYESALTLCRAAAEAEQRAYFDPQRLKKSIPDRNDTLCAASGIAKITGEAAYRISVGRIKGDFYGCIGNGTSEETCQKALARSWGDAYLALLNSFYECCEKTRAPHDAYASCDMVCLRAIISHRINTFFHDAPGGLIQDGDETYNPCRNACLTAHGATRDCALCSEQALSRFNAAISSGIYTLFSDAVDHPPRYDGQGD